MKVQDLRDVREGDAREGEAREGDIREGDAREGNVRKGNTGEVPRPAVSDSRQRITLALLSLMEVKDYALISVRDICLASGLSRQTFYNLYSSREDVLRCDLKEKLSEGHKLLPRPDQPGIPSPEEILNAYATVLEKHRHVLTLLCRQGLSALLMEELAEAITPYAANCTPRLASEESSGAAAFLSGGISHLLLWQLNQEEGTPRDSSADILSACLSDNWTSTRQSAAPPDPTKTRQPAAPPDPTKGRLTGEALPEVLL